MKCFYLWVLRGNPLLPVFGILSPGRVRKANIATGTPYAKELGLLNYVLSNASPGEPESVVQALP